MPTWIRIVKWTIINVGIPIKTLWVVRVRDNRIRLHEPRQPRLIIPCIVIIQSRIAIIHLPGVLAAGLRPITVMGTTPRVIAHLGGFRATAVQRVARTAQMVNKRVGRHAPLYALHFESLKIAHVICFLKYQLLLFPYLKIIF